jgi:eukaryotic-like serine/threonine-protein kinase
VPFYQRNGWSEFDASPGILIYSTGLPKLQLAWVDRSGRRLSNLGDPQNILVSFRLSLDGKKLAFDAWDVSKGSADIWVYDLSKNTAERVTTEPGMEIHPVWSPDGTRLAFGSGQSGVPGLLLKVKGLAERGNWEAFPRGDQNFQSPTDWSPDGRWISYQTFNEEIWLASVADHKMIPLLQTGFGIQQAVFSPNREHVAFATNENGPWEIYVQRFEAGDSPRVAGSRLRVSHNGGRFPQWRRDGKELFFLSPERQIMAVAVQQGAEIGFGPPTALFTLPPSSPSLASEGYGYDVNADGQKFLVLSGGAVAPLQVVVNWQAELKG